MTKTITTRQWTWLIIIVLLTVILGYWYWSDSQSIVVLRPNGKATFYRGGFFHRDKLELMVFRGKWHFSNTEKGNFESGDLIVPFECPYNEYRTLHLEAGGKVYVLDKKAMSRYELRVVDGEWSYDADDHWQSIFDLD
jgi:hypothetical protein